MSDESALTPRQTLFVEAIIGGMSARAAAVEAGYGERGARSTGPRLLKNAAVAAAIEARRAEIVAESNITGDWVLKRAVDTFHAAYQRGNYATCSSILALLAKVLGGTQEVHQHLHLEGLSPNEIRHIAGLRLPEEETTDDLP